MNIPLGKSASFVGTWGELKHGFDFFPSFSAGGIEMYAHKGKIKVDNTLEARAQMIAEKMMPQIREALFGANENRKFYD